MRAIKKIFLLSTVLLFALTFNIYGQKENTFSLIKESYDKFLNTPLKVTYTREFCRFHKTEDIVETLSDGKVFVEIPGARREIHTDSIDIDENVKKVMEIDPVYNLPVMKTVATITVWMNGERYYAEESYDSGSSVSQRYDSDVSEEMLQSTQGRKLRVIETQGKAGFNNINLLLAYYSEKWTNRTETMRVIETDTNVTIVQEFPNNEMREIVLEKTIGGYIPRAKRYFSRGHLAGETCFDGMVKIDEISLPTQISRKTFRSQDTPNLFIFYNDLKWEKVSLPEVEEKISKELQ